MAVPTLKPERRTGRSYWRANAIAELSLARFEEALAASEPAVQRHAYYLLAAYHRRTRRIVRSALADRRDPLAEAALRNLILLQRPLVRMHDASPAVIPFVSVLDRPAREELARDLIVRALADTADPQAEDALLARVTEQ